MIAIQGDNHGDISTLMTNIDMYGTTGMTIFHVGDFGYNLNREYQDEYHYTAILKKFNRFLKSRGIWMYVIRGNHDRPYYFDGRFTLSNFKMVPDYTVVTVHGKRWLMVGGALSVDRKGRRQGINYWNDEVFNLEPDKYKHLRDIDYVITHTPPTVGLDYDVLHSDTVENYAKHFKDPHLIHECVVERLKVQELYEGLKFNNDITNWYYGHFHFHMDNTHDGTRFICVPQDKLIEHADRPKEDQEG